MWKRDVLVDVWISAKKSRKCLGQDFQQLHYSKSLRPTRVSVSGGSKGPTSAYNLRAGRAYMMPTWHAVFSTVFQRLKKIPDFLGFWNSVSLYPLVIQHSYRKIHHAIHGKIHYFNGGSFHSHVTNYQRVNPISSHYSPLLTIKSTFIVLFPPSVGIYFGHELSRWAAHARQDTVAPRTPLEKKLLVAFCQVEMAGNSWKVCKNEVLKRWRRRKFPEETRKMSSRYPLVI